MAQAFVYIYDKLIEHDVILPDNIMKHCDKKKVISKKLVSLSTYFKLKIKLKEHFNIDIKKLYFEDNKPKIDGINISLTHTDKYYGFIISESKVGIDIEHFINNDKLAKRILDSNEYDKYLSAPLILTVKWCLLEAYYKMLGCSEIDENNFKNKTIFRLDDSILLAIGDYDEIKIFLNDGEIL